MAYRTSRRLEGLAQTIPTLSTLALLWGCSHTNSHQVQAPSSEEEAFARQAFATPELEASTPGPVQLAQRRQVGDSTVHRFSGNFSKHALFLKEEVVEVNADTFSVLYTLDEGASVSELLVVRTNRSERIVSVSRIDAGRTIPAQLADYEAMIGKTLVTPDQNRGAIAKSDSTCLVGSTEHHCEIAEYRVYVADQEAKLSVARSPELDRDVSGEIVALDGTLIYHAELIDVKKQSSPSHTEEVAVISPLE